MAKKDFSNVNTDRVYAAIADATADPASTSEQIPQEEPERNTYKERKTYTEEEAREALDNMKTQGKKGVKLQRINMAFPPEIYDYIKIMSSARGQTITDFVNEIIQQSLDANRDTLEKAKELIKGLRSL